MYNTVFWDFNGTIINDMPLCIKSINKLLADRGLPKIKEQDEYRRKFHFPVKDYYAGLGFDFSVEPYEDVAREWFDLYAAEEETVPPTDGIFEALKALDDAGAEQIILTASQSDILVRQLKRLGIDGYFSHMIAQDNIYAAGKTESALRFLGGRKLKCALIGDTLHDYATAVSIGATPYLYSSGHGYEPELLSTGAFVSRTLDGIIREILS